MIGGGVLLLLAALCLTVCNLEEDRRAGENAARAVSGIREKAKERAPSPPPEGKPPENGAPEEELAPVPAYVADPTVEMPVVEIDGHGYIGTLDIPALELSLPVMNTWSYPDLKLAPCRYRGSAYLDDLIVAGHNYRTHFGRLNQLGAGEEVRFTDGEGNLFLYTVAELEKLPSTAVEEMETGDWDLTLFTCTVGGKARVAVRCVRSMEGPDPGQNTTQTKSRSLLQNT